MIFGNEGVLCKDEYAEEVEGKKLPNVTNTPAIVIIHIPIIIGKYQVFILYYILNKHDLKHQCNFLPNV
jgi:hypothetical protein